MDLGTFCETHELQPFTKPGPKQKDHPDAYVQLTEADGLMLMPCIENMVLTAADPNSNPPFVANPETAYLWLIRDDDLAVVAEHAPLRELTKAKHTNLSGGEKARCGGEARLVDDDNITLHVNGGSGRYSARSQQELDDAVTVFEQYHTPVQSAGWDEDTDAPARWFRG
ncbi:hypothetical protein [Rathayibacter sp. AY2B5]|uniref:hypothetical protein n=1 Tax=Rathayibacter sp. AY2B5 TaxID=2080570 RepID=UPI0011B08273|nr:hypothetical protein [Rathayibacter sp. AY2B5]